MFDLRSRFGISDLPRLEGLRAAHAVGVDLLVNVSGVETAALYGDLSLVGMEVSDFRFADVFSVASESDHEQWVTDLGALGFEQLCLAVRCTSKALSRGRFPLVICSRGRARSALVLATALSLARSLEPSRARRAVLAVRKQCEFGPRSLLAFAAIHARLSAETEVYEGRDE